MKMTSDKGCKLLIWSKERWLIIALLLFSLFIRIYKIDTNLPNTYMHDEDNFIETALRFGTGNLRPYGLQHGMLLPLMLFAEYGTYYLIKKFTVADYNPTDILTEYISNPTYFYLIGRITATLFAVGSIFLVYLISLKLFTKRAANLSSLFFSLSLVPFIESKWTRASMVSVFFLLLALLISIPLLANIPKSKKSSIRYYIMSGFFVGLATAAKLYSIFGFTFIFLVHIFAYKHRNSYRKIAGYLMHIFNRKIIISGMFLIIGFFLGTPYALINPKFFFVNLSQIHNELFDPITKNPWLLYFISHLKNAVGSRPLEILILISFMFFLFRRSKKEIIFLVYPISLYLLYMSYPGFAHYLVPAIPFLVILTGSFLDLVLKSVSNLKVKVIVVAIIFIAIAPSFLNILRFTMLISKPDTRTLAKDWIEKNISQSSLILSEGYILTMPTHVPQLKSNLETLNRDLALVRLKKGRGLLVESEINYAQNDKVNKRYNIYKVRILDADTLNNLNADYVILCGYLDRFYRITGVEIDMNIEESQYSLRSSNFFKKRKALYTELEKKYALIKNFTPYPKLSIYFPLLPIDDFKKLESINLLKDRQRLLQGPEIRIYSKRDIKLNQKNKII